MLKELPQSSCTENTLFSSVGENRRSYSEGYTDTPNALGFGLSPYQKLKVLC